jgi:hypothetical protein
MADTAPFIIHTIIYIYIYIYVRACHDHVSFPSRSDQAITSLPIFVRVNMNSEVTKSIQGQNAKVAYERNG